MFITCEFTYKLSNMRACFGCSFIYMHS